MIIPTPWQQNSYVPLDKQAWEVLYYNLDKSKQMFIHYKERQLAQENVERFGETWNAVADRRFGDNDWENLIGGINV